jgi:S1-C subfamily serine protease
VFKPALMKKAARIAAYCLLVLCSNVLSRGQGVSSLIPDRQPGDHIVSRTNDGGIIWSNGVTKWKDGTMVVDRAGERIVIHPNGHYEILQKTETVVRRKDPETGVDRYYRVGPDNKAVEIKFPGDVTSKGSNRNRDSSNSSAASGTGFFISPDGYLLTNYHLVSGSHKIVVRISATEKPAKVVRIDAGNDLALLKVDGNFSAIPLGDVRAVAVGDSVMTIGYPNIQVQGFAAKFTKGEVSSLTGFQDDPRLFQISVPIQPGNSGGPLIDDRGNAVGITNAQLSALKMIATSGSIPQNVNYAVKISYAQLLLDSIPEIAGRLPKPHKDKGEAAKIIDETEKATVLIVVWQ